MNLPKIDNSHFRLYAAAAAQLGIKWKVVVSGKVMELSYGDQRYYFYRAATPLNRQSHVRLAHSKWVVAQVLRPHGISVPEQKRIRHLPELVDFHQQHEAIVVKPHNSHGGKGVSILPGAVDLPVAFKSAFEARENPFILAEPYYVGNNYRLLLVDGQFLAGVWRQVPEVTGDGVQTIDQLVAAYNATCHQINAEPMPQDAEYEHTLNLFGVAPNTVLAKGAVQAVRLTSNLSQGGTTEDVTDRVHPSFVKIAKKVSDILQLRLIAIDLITKDIGQEGRYVINEVNISPGLRIHYQPHRGPIRDVAPPILKALFGIA